MLRTARTPAKARPLLLPLCLWVLAACASSGAPDLAEATPYTPPKPPEPDSIGFFLTDFDNSVRAWTNLKLGGKERDARKLRTLEREMGERAAKRRDELVRELESGPVNNRAVAAVALGFTADPTVQSALLAALSDQEEIVVHNALLGLGQLGLPDTPPAQVCYLLRNDPDPWIRNNAAFVVQRMASAGADDPGLVDACRAALGDEEAGVRAQCASSLGLMVDTGSIPALGDLLYDDVALVSAAAASSLARIGRMSMEHKGETARLLADALERVPRDGRSIVLVELMRLAESDLGQESDAWKEWAYRLP